MGLLWILMAVLFSITLFLYSREWISGLKGHRRKIKAENKDFSQKYERICPVCHAKLKQNENLYISIYPGEPKDKIFIKGCKYCYRTQKSGDRTL